MKPGSVGLGGMKPLLVLRQTDVAGTRVATLLIVTDFDVVENGASGRLVRDEGLLGVPFVFERAEKAFDDGVLPAVSLSAHAARDPLHGRGAPGTLLNLARLKFRSRESVAVKQSSLLRIRIGSWFPLGACCVDSRCRRATPLRRA